jgi:AcrR family transcriptional regulator
MPRQQPSRAAIRAARPTARGSPAPALRNRSEVEERLITAVGTVLASRGFAELGINRVAREAGVSKVLIYRYFGDLDGLVAAYARSATFFPSMDELVPDVPALLRMPPAERFVAFQRRYLAALRARPSTVAVLALESVESTPFHAALEASREELGLSLIRTLGADIPPHIDHAAVATWVTGAVHYLLIRARHVKVFNGVPIQTQAGWDRLLAMLQPMVEGALSVPPPQQASRAAEAPPPRQRRPSAAATRPRAQR